MIPQETMEKMRVEIGEWSQANFGRQITRRLTVPLSSGQAEAIDVNLEYIAPLMGMMEELGELVSAVVNKDDAETTDAIADIGIYLCDFSVRVGVVIKWCCVSKYDKENSLDWECKRSAALKSLTQHIGTLAHHVLKFHQGIREYSPENDPDFESRFATPEFKLNVFGCLEQIAYTLELLAHNLDESASANAIIHEVWTEKVKKRNWKKDASGGGE